MKEGVVGVAGAVKDGVRVVVGWVVVVTELCGGVGVWLGVVGVVVRGLGLVVVVGVVTILPPSLW